MNDYYFCIRCDKHHETYKGCPRDNKHPIGLYGMFLVVVAVVVLVLMFIPDVKASDGGKWKITAYCAEKCCCGKWSDGYFASGKRVYVGGVACNILPFGTDVYIKGRGVYTVEDRGAKSYFDNQKHIDIYMEDHNEALRFGVKWKEVEIL